jgi:predicted alpha/beta-hydrolase family hydrolase
MFPPVSSTFKVDVSEQAAVTVKAAVPGRWRSETAALILAHGANNDLDHPLLAYLAEHLVDWANVLVVRFNFPYVERGASSPDPERLLEDTFRRVHDHVVDELCGPGSPVFLGGKSLGGRVAAELVSRGREAEGLLVAGLIVLGYPLHAPGRRDRLRVEPLRRVGIPSLFFQGTRDPFCDPELFRPIVAGLSHPGELHIVEGGDHSLHLPSSSKRRPQDSYDDVAHRIADFVETVSGAI